MKFKNPKYIEMIRKFIPGFDFEKERNWSEMQSIRKIISEKIEKQGEENSKKIRLAAIKEKGLSPEIKALFDGKELITIGSIGTSGYVQIKGRRGSFNPIHFEVIRK